MIWSFSLNYPSYKCIVTSTYHPVESNKYSILLLYVLLSWLPGTYIKSSFHHIVSHDLSIAHLALSYFSQLFLRQCIIRDMYLTCSVTFYPLHFTWNFMFGRFQWHIITNTPRPALSAAPHVLSDLNYAWILSINFSKSPDIKFHKILAAVAKLFCVDTQTDRHDEAVTFHNFANTS
jgi:hypothetical protein